VHCGAIGHPTRASAAPPVRLTRGVVWCVRRFRAMRSPVAHCCSNGCVISSRCMHCFLVSLVGITGYSGYSGFSSTLRGSTTAASRPRNAVGCMTLSACGKRGSCIGRWATRANVSVRSACAGLACCTTAAACCCQRCHGHPGARRPIRTRIDRSGGRAVGKAMRALSAVASKRARVDRPLYAAMHRSGRDPPPNLVCLEWVSGMGRPQRDASP
jgi:hypothetical protein